MYLLKYLCKGAGSTMTAADEKYDDDVEMLAEQVFCGFSIVCAVKRETGEELVLPNVRAADGG